MAADDWPTPREADPLTVPEDVFRLRRRSLDGSLGYYQGYDAALRYAAHVRGLRYVFMAGLATGVLATCALVAVAWYAGWRG